MHLAGSGILQTSTLPTLRKMVVLPGWPTAPGQGSRGAWGRGGGVRQGLERQPWPQREPPRSSRYRHNSIQGLTGFRGVPHQHRVHGE